MCCPVNKLKIQITCMYFASILVAAQGQFLTTYCIRNFLPLYSVLGWFSCSEHLNYIPLPLCKHLRQCNLRCFRNCNCCYLLVQHIHFSHSFFAILKVGNKKSHFPDLEKKSMKKQKCKSFTHSQKKKDGILSIVRILQWKKIENYYETEEER